jgi:uncharacterized protein (UPF0276 family)
MPNVLPSLGVGIIYATGLDEVVVAAIDAAVLDLVEVEPETLWATSGAAYRVNERAIARLSAIDRPKLVHGVGFPVGGTAPFDVDHVRRFVEVATHLGSPWVSEHLSFSRTERDGRWHATGFLLPPLQSSEGVDLAASNIRRLSAYLPVPFAFETGVNYLRPQRGELTDGAFFGAVAEAADCGILLDLHNVWTNERNGRQPVLEALSEMPLDRVWEMHLAGGELFGSYWLDAHSDLVANELLELADVVIPMLPNLHALNFEIMPDYIQAKGIGVDALVGQLATLQSLWSRRRVRVRAAAHARTTSSRAVSQGLPSPSDWETALGRLVIGDAAFESLGSDLATDPGVDVLRRLAEAGRAGTVVDCLSLSSRLLMLELGSDGLWKLLQAFWTSTPPQAFGIDEARSFAAFVRSRELDIPHLGVVLAFELTTLDVLVEDRPMTVAFDCDPVPLLSSLGEGRRPDKLRPGRYELLIEP